MKTVAHSVRRTRKPAGLKARGLRFETVEARLAMSGLAAAVIDPAMLGAGGAATRGAAASAAEVASALSGDAGSRDGAGIMGQLPPQRLSLSDGSLDPHLVDFWMTQRPNQEPTPGADLGRWFSCGGGLDFGLLDDTSGFGPSFGSGWGGPTGQSPFGGPSPYGALDNPFQSPAGFQGLTFGGLRDGVPTGVGGMPILDPSMNGGQAAKGAGNTEGWSLATFVSIRGLSGSTWYSTEGNEFQRARVVSLVHDSIEALAKSVTVIVPESAGDTVIEVAFTNVVGENRTVIVFEVDQDGFVNVIVEPCPGGQGLGAPEQDSTPANPHEAFDSVWYVYANLRIEAPTHDDTRIDILINPRSMTDGAAGGSVQMVGFGGQTAAFGGGAAAGPGMVNVLPFVGNVDPNPLTPGGPSASSGLSSALVSALSLRDPVPIG